MRQRCLTNSMTGLVSSKIMMNHCVARRVHGCSSSGRDIEVPRRITARAIVAEFTQCRPPKRSLAIEARKYVATAPIQTIRKAHPACSLDRRSRSPARPTVGMTNSARMKPIRSWSTLP